MLRFTVIRNVIAVITMTVAALCGGGKAIAAQGDLLSAVEVQNGDILRLDGSKTLTLHIASAETAIVAATGAMSEKSAFDASYAPRAQVSLSFQDRKTSLLTDKSADQFRKLGALVRPPTRAPPATFRTG